MTSDATSRSETASETMSKFDGVRKRRTMATAVQTSRLPSTVPAMMMRHPVSVSTVRHPMTDESPSYVVDCVVDAIELLPSVAFASISSSSSLAAATGVTRANAGVYLKEVEQ